MSPRPSSRSRQCGCRIPALVELGKKLFFDPRLSRSGFISCSSCHNLSMGGSDNLRTSIGHNWQRGNANTPTILNVSLSVSQYWDGRALTLQDQATQPIAEPTQMGSTHALALEVLNTIPGYVGEFNKVFRPGKIDLRKVSAAIAAFEATLLTPDSRFDRWLKGDRKAINARGAGGLSPLQALRLHGVPLRPGPGRPVLREDGHHATLSLQDVFPRPRSRDR